MKRKFVITKRYLYTWILFIMWFPMPSVIDVYSSWFNIMKLVICGYTILRGINRRKPDYKYSVVWIYFLVLVFSTMRQQNTKNVLLAIVYAIGVLSIFYYFKRTSFFENRSAFYFIITVYVIANALTVLFTKNGITENAWGQANYLIGGKFSVLYLSMIWLATYFYSGKCNNKLKISIAIVLLALLSYRTDCSTGIFCFFIIWIAFISKKLQEFLFRPIVIIGITALLNVLLVAYNNFLQSGVAAYIVQNVLHRNLNLTGRIEIYTYFFALIKQDLFLGKGYNNTLIASSLGYLNAQNGFLDVIAKCGILGLAFFGVILVVAVFESYKSEKKDSILQAIWPIFFAFIIAGLVEISFNMYFFLIVAIMFSATKESPKAYIQKGNVYEKTGIKLRRNSET